MHDAREPLKVNQIESMKKKKKKKRWNFTPNMNHTLSKGKRLIHIYGNNQKLSFTDLQPAQFVTVKSCV